MRPDISFVAKGLPSCRGLWSLIAVTGAIAYAYGRRRRILLHIVLPIRPRYAAAIVNGSKIAEYRRSPPRRGLPGLAMLYETRPMSAVTAVMAMDAPRLLDSDEVRGLDPDVVAYLAGAPAPCALPIRSVTVLPRPIGFAELADAGVRAPQSWCYISADLAGRLGVVP